MRKIPALVAAGGLLLSMTACATQSAAGGMDGCEPVIASGDASAAISASGEVGTSPEIELPSPLYAAENERSVLTVGDGPMIGEGAPVIFQFSIFNGRDGSLLQESEYGENGGTILTATEDATTNPGIEDALMCTTVGSRIAIVLSPEDSHGGQGIAQLGVEADDSLVYVIDVAEAFLPKADGVNQLVARNDLPAVVTAPNGTPGITVPDAEAPADLIVETVKAGDGETVEADDQVVVHYTGVLWDGGTVFDSSWQNGAPALFTLDSVVPGFAEALEGAQVGSQVLAVIPPELAYGDEGSGSVPAGSTLVFVIDVLGIR